MTERTPIQVGTDRRSMSVKLNASEMAARSAQAHNENAARRRMESERDALEAEAKAKRDEAKALTERIAQKQLEIDRLSEAARTGEEQRPVDLVFKFDPSSCYVIGTREDTGEEVERRTPDAEDNDVIKRHMQPPLPGVDATPAPATTAAARTIVADEPANPTATLPYPIHPARRTHVAMSAEFIAGLPAKARDLGGADRAGGFAQRKDRGIYLGLGLVGDDPADITDEQAAAIEEAYDAGFEGEPEETADRGEETQETPPVFDREAIQTRVDASTLTAVAAELGMGRDKLARLLGRRK